MKYESDGDTSLRERAFTVGSNLPSNSPSKFSDNKRFDIVFAEAIFLL